MYNEAACHWDLFYSIQMDIENYNYIDMLLRENLAGRLTEEYRKIEVEKFKKQQEDKTKT